MSGAERVVFIADAHLGEADPEEEQRKQAHLLSFLAHLDPQTDRLVICGDLFDFWFEYRYVVAAQYVRVIGLLAELAESGLRIDYVAGNHDFWMRDFFPRQLGIPVHKKDLRFEELGVQIYACHGDGLRKSDRGYRILKRVLQNPLNIALFRWLHPDVGYALAHFFADLSRRKNAHPYRELDDSDYVEYADRMLASGADLVVLAHTHKRRLLRRPDGVFLNPGEWLGAYTFGELRGHTVSLKKWLSDSPSEIEQETVASVELPR